MTCKAIQEKFSASSLNTNDCFVLVNPDQVTVWFGKGSTGDEREMAKALAITKNPEPELMFEGQEKGSFWSDLGGGGEVDHGGQDGDADGWLQASRSTSQIWSPGRRKMMLSQGSSSCPG